MSEAIWYYVDGRQQRQGPVVAEVVAAAYAAGTIGDDSLVWREGLGAWAPLSSHRGELGIVGPPRVLPTPHVQQAYPPPSTGLSRKTGCLLVAIGAAVLGIPVLAILAAIALPAYQDYVARAQTAGALAALQPWTAAADEAFARDGRCPTTVEALGAPSELAFGGSRSGTLTVAENAPGACVLAIDLGGGSPVLAGARLRLIRDAEGGWACFGSVRHPKYLPRDCQPD